MKNLTEKQHDVLDFILWHIRENGWQPTIREICAEFQWAGTQAAFDHLRALERKGYIERTGKARAIKILKPLDPPG